jgi:hypothetical protein
MGTSTISLTPPFSMAKLSSLDPVLAFYVKYALAFGDLENTDSRRFYSANATLTFPDAMVLQGGARIWAFYRQIYVPFKKSPAECLSLHLDSDDTTSIHMLHVETIRSLYDVDDKLVSTIPQYFIYTIGVADDGAGTDGFQIKGVRCYYDYSLIKTAAALIGVDVSQWRTFNIQE